MSESCIDPEIERAGLEMMVAFRKQFDKICLEAGMTQEEIQKTVEEAMKGIYINGVPVRR